MVKKQLKIYQPIKKVLWLTSTLLVVLLDQISKNIASATLDIENSVPFLPYFNFTLLHNYGAAFSFLSDETGWQRLFLGIVTLVISVCLVFWILFLRTEKKYEILGLSLILGGAIGNLLDRIYLGYVVDFIDWFYISSTNECLFFFYSIVSTRTCHWPAFNIADSAIMLGVTSLLVNNLFYEKSKRLKTNG